MRRIRTRLRLEKVLIELRAELGRPPSERETWLEFRARHPRAARQILENAVMPPGRGAYP